MRSGIFKTKPRDTLKNIMKTPSKFLLLAAFLAVSAWPVHAADAPAVAVGVNALVAQPGDQEGKILYLTGIVHRVSAARRMIILVDTSEADCTDACTPATVVVQLDGKPENLPEPKTPILIIGKLKGKATPVTLAASEWITGEENIASRLRERAP